jgi:putative oxidoreductase
MNIVLWVVQVVLALVFLGSGVTKVIQSPEKLAPRMHWVPHFPVAFVRFIGVSEALAGIGLILPALTKILPWLTIAAAGGLIIVMVSAIVVNARMGDYKTITPNVVFLLLATFVMIGRIALQPL